MRDGIESLNRCLFVDATAAMAEQSKIRRRVWLLGIIALVSLVITRTSVVLGGYGLIRAVLGPLGLGALWLAFYTAFPVAPHPRSRWSHVALFLAVLVILAEVLLVFETPGQGNTAGWQAEAAMPVGGSIGLFIRLSGSVFLLLFLPRSRWSHFALIAAVLVILAEVLLVLEILGQGYTAGWWAERASPIVGFLSLFFRLSGSVFLICFLPMALYSVIADVRLRRRMLEASHDLIISLDRDGVILTVNATTRRVLGYEEAEIVGRPISDIQPENLLKSTASVYARVMAGECLTNYGAVLVRKDGELAFVEADIYPRYSESGKIVGGMALCDDVTSYRRAIDKLQAGEVELQEALSELKSQKYALDVHAIVAITNTNGRILYANDLFCETSKFSRKELIGRNFSILNSGFHPPEFMEGMWSHLLDGNIWKGEIRNKAKDGSIFWVDATLVPFKDDEGRVIQLIAIQTDITARKRAEDQEGVLQKQLIRAQRLETVGVMAEGIAHDLNNLLTPIVGYTELACEQLSPGSAVGEDLRCVLQAAERAREVVAQVLAFGRESEVPAAPVSLQEVMLEAIHLARSPLPATIAIRHDIDTDSDPVKADRGQIHQVVMNLITNAMHALGDNGGSIDLGLRPVELNGAFFRRFPELEPGPFLCLSVADTGHGMDESTRSKLFDPFFTTKPSSVGTGLGLSVAAEIISRHKGAIEVESKVGEGTTFRIYLPASSEDQAATAELTGGEARARGSERVLFVDDMELIAASSERMLSLLGYDVQSFGGGVDALEAFEQAPDTFDIVVTDYTMKRMSGLELARRIHAVRSDLPIILTSGNPPLRSDAEFETLGIRRVLEKPYSLSELCGTIRCVCDKKDPAQGEVRISA